MESVAYDDWGRPVTYTHPGSSTTTKTYNAVDQVAAVTDELSHTSTLAYDDAGNLTSATKGGVTTSYTCDGNDQLLTESRTGYSATYTYDANGNRASKTLNSSTDTYTVDDADKLTSITNGGVTIKSYGYDAAGRTHTVTTSAGTTTLDYDYEGRITTITYPNSSTNTFTYNGLDTRVGKVDSAGTSTYKRDGAEVTDPVLTDGSATYTPGISERRGSTSKFYGTDRLGTNSLETDSSQATTATRQYDAFGMLVASTGSSAGPFGFAGKVGYQEDGNSDLKLLGHRYYDASTGRFLTRDPAQDGRDWYAYCENNPLAYEDPTGQFAAVAGAVVLIACVAIVAIAVMTAPAVKEKMAPIVQPLGDWLNRLGSRISLGPRDIPGLPMQARSNEELAKTVQEVLKSRKGSIKQAPLPPGFPGWERLLPLTIKAVEEGAKKNSPGFKEALKLLYDQEYRK